MPFSALSILDAVFPRSHSGAWDMLWTCCCLLLIALIYALPRSRHHAQFAQNLHETPFDQHEPRPGDEVKNIRERVNGRSGGKAVTTAESLSTSRCNGSGMERPPKAELGMQILHDCEEATVDFVAVHGLGANPDYAWVWLPKNNPIESHAHPNKPFNWLRELLPTKLSCRVLAFNYDSTWLSANSAPQQRLSNIADNLLDSLRALRDNAVDRPLIFIGHSFGGNIIEQAIVSASRVESMHRHITESTVGVVFLGTPHRGSQAAAWGKWIAWLASCGAHTEDRLLRALEEGSDSLTDRLHDFSRWLFCESVPVICCFEQLPTDYSSRTGVVGEFVWQLIPSRRFKELVVPEISACIDGHCKISLHTDHLKINKFFGSDDPSFKRIYPEIVRMAENSNGELTRRRNPDKIPTSEKSTSGDLRKCLQKMDVRNPEYVLRGIRSQKGERVKHSCEWILKREEFSFWGASEGSQFLQLVGPPGIGKTMISTFLVQELRRKVEKSRGKAFAYFFCDDKDWDRKTPTAIIRSLIWQLLLQRQELFRHIQPDFEKYTDDRVFDGLFNDFSALWHILLCMLQDERAGEVFVLIDALDECESSTRENLLVEMKHLFQPPLCVSSGRIKLLITCRPGIHDIEYHLSAVCTSLRIDSAKISDDLAEYIDIKVNNLRDIGGKSYPGVLKNNVRSALKDRAGGTFLWASLMLAELQGVLMSNVEEKLKNLPHGLDNTYTMILDRISDGYRETAQFVLWCMAAARRPLRKSEIQTAYAIWKTNSVQYGEDLEIYGDIHSVCSSLIFVGSEDDAMLNFCHQSVKDFLLHDTSTTNSWYHCTEGKAHLRLFKACWVYLSAEKFGFSSLAARRDGETGRLLKPNRWNMRDEVSQHSFLEYSSSEWDNHAIASHEVLLRNWHELAIDVTRTPALRDAWLLRAAGEGQEVIVKFLLDKSADINTKDKDNRTPLSRAAEQGHGGIVKLLLDNSADADPRDHTGRTPLSWAAATGRTSVATLLLDSGNAKADASDNNGRTPLSYAAERGHEAIVHRLLGENINVNSKYHGMGQVTMLYAIRINGQEVAQTLFDGASKAFMGGLNQSAPKCFDVSKVFDIIDSMSQHEHEGAKRGKSPLLLSTDHGLGTVELVLIRDVGGPGAYGQTPLHLAAWHGHGNIVRMLLDVDGIVAHTIDEIKRTPLLSAAAAGHLEVVELLLTADGMDRDFKDVDGQTALSWAIKEGHDSIVELLQANSN